MSGPEDADARGPDPAPLYVSRVRVERVAPLVRRARLPLGATAELGVHGPIVPFFGLSPAREVPLPVDYIVAATGG
ncbi:MAG TPA: hypothetical protein VFK69_06205 [Candidatus Eisenbacteria bacterium]|nr:hypothetical protein [Candidatus Eisenbacteria bacterium]